LLQAIEPTGFFSSKASKNLIYAFEYFVAHFWEFAWEKSSLFSFCRYQVPIWIAQLRKCGLSISSKNVYLLSDFLDESPVFLPC